MIVLIDNYDSFTYNLVQYFREIQWAPRVEVYRNDALTPIQIEQKKPQAIVISPGPGAPKDAGITLEVIHQFKGKYPILGVCLGHQAIAEAFGGQIIRAPRLMHGKTSPVYHDQQSIFQGIPSPFIAARYHSLVVERESFPGELEITAETAEGEIMALRHRVLPIVGVQFHPESILSEHGKQLLSQFLKEYIPC